MFQAMPVGIWGVIRGVHADGFGVSPREGAADSTGDAGDRKVVAHDGDADFSEGSDHCLEVFKLLFLCRTIEEDVMPVGGVEVLDRFEFQAFIVDVALESRGVLRKTRACLGSPARPRPVSTGGIGRWGVASAWLKLSRGGMTRWVAAALSREPVVVAREQWR
jgi:hypothetical protein